MEEHNLSLHFSTRLAGDFPPAEMFCHLLVSKYKIQEIILMQSNLTNGPPRSSTAALQIAQTIGARSQANHPLIFGNHIGENFWYSIKHIQTSSEQLEPSVFH